MTDALISILIANFNNENYLDEAIQSIKNQTYHNWEVVIYDDASYNQDWIQIFEKKHKNLNLKIFSGKENRGCGYVKRKLIEICNGDYFLFLDPDDALHYNCLRVLYDDLYNREGFGLSYGTHFICNEKLEVDYISSYPSILEKGETMFARDTGNISAPALVSKSYYQKTPGINQSLLKAVDNDLYALIEEVAYVSFVHAPLYYYRQHSTNISTGRNELDALKFRRIVIGNLTERRKSNGFSCARNLTKQELFENEYHYYSLLFYKSKLFSIQFAIAVFRTIIIHFYLNKSLKGLIGLFITKLRIKY